MKKQQGLSAKTVCLYAFLTGAALLFGYAENFISFDFIAPGIKLGTSNVIVLFLVCNKNYKAAFFVNFARILISALLFSNALTLAFSLTAGMTALIFECLVNKFLKFGVVGLSVLGGTVHNITQLCVAAAAVENGVWYYAPVLLVFGAIAGVITGILTGVLLKKTENYFNSFFKKEKGD